MEKEKMESTTGDRYNKIERVFFPLVFIFMLLVGIYFFYEVHKKDKQKAQALAVQKEREAACFQACSRGDEAAVRKYLQEGGNPSADVDKVSLLYQACKNGHNNVMRMLLQGGANPNVKVGKTRSSLVHSSCRYDNIEATEILLKAGADPNVCNNFRCPPLVRCSKYGDLERAKLLLRHGAKESINHIGGYKRKITALHVAVSGRHLDMVKLLIANGANANVSDDTMANPIRALLMSDHQDIEILKVLLEAGADPNNRGKCGPSNVKRARTLGRGDLVDLLKAYGGKE